MFLKISPIIKIMLLCSLALISGNILICQQKSIENNLLNHENKKQVLNGHSFITNSLIDDPFINTSFQLSAGIGTSSNYDLPLVIRGREIKGLFGQITYAALNLKYQHRIKNWLGFSAAIGMKGRLGSQTISMITEGVNIGTSFNFGWKFKMLESKRLALSSLLFISNQSVTVFNMYDFIDKIIENGEITQDNKLVKTTNITAGVIGINSAYAFNKTFGFLGKFNFGYGESISSHNKGYFDAGISFDADLNPGLSFPLGIAAGYDWNNFSQSDINITNPQNIIFKLSYTGRKDLDMGVEMNAQFFNLTRLNNDISLKVIFLKANIGYFF